MSGLGVDRHLQGLKLVALEAGLDLPAIYSDPGFLKSSRMRISSSQVRLLPERNHRMRQTCMKDPILEKGRKNNL